MEKKLYEYRILVRDPNGSILKTSEADKFEIGSEGMIGSLDIYDLDFKTAGNYDFEFQFKLDGEYKMVENKILIVK